MNTSGENLSDVMRAVGLLYRRATRTFEQDRIGLPVGVRAVLELLSLTTAQPVPRIAETLLLSRQFVQRSVDHGIELGIFELQNNPAHRRSRLVSVTAEGRSTIERVLQREQELLVVAREQLTEDEISTCLHVLHTIREQADWSPADER
ncbi:MarR family transcriptional regulator [Brevibacterium antiquum]|uniref:MarR family winged helix-turn-helix transcriptional regulator n=1 Tax=Brevibacterium antiquum TaxID=234835 RepID=UPI0018DF43F5|nr:MarR family winged helix-turn-helix transcriptional regulator [Brevibacterium antiquum]